MPLHRGKYPFNSAWGFHIKGRESPAEVLTDETRSPLENMDMFQLLWLGEAALTVANLTQVQTIDNVTLTAHVPNYVLVVQDLTQAQTIEAVTLTAHAPNWVLTVQNIVQAQVFGNVDLVAHAPGVPDVNPPENPSASVQSGGIQFIPNPYYFPPVDDPEEEELFVLLASMRL